MIKGDCSINNVTIEQLGMSVDLPFMVEFTDEELSKKDVIPRQIEYMLTKIIKELVEKGNFQNG